MDKSLPDKWIRKAVYDAVNDIVVSSKKIPCYDVRVSIGENRDKPRNYILMSSQSNEVNKQSKCEYIWESQILLDIVTIYSGAGNPGSRLLADNILDAVRNALKDIQLDVTSGLNVMNRRFSFPNDITTITDKESVFRKLMRIELDIQ